MTSGNLQGFAGDTISLYSSNTMFLNSGFNIMADSTDFISLHGANSVALFGGNAMTGEGGDLVSLSSGNMLGLYSKVDIMGNANNFLSLFGANSLALTAGTVVTAQAGTGAILLPNGTAQLASLQAVLDAW
jgi:hypothetical protein